MFFQKIWSAQNVFKLDHCAQCKKSSKKIKPTFYKKISDILNGERFSSLLNWVVFIQLSRTWMAISENRLNHFQYSARFFPSWLNYKQWSSLHFLNFYISANGVTSTQLHRMATCPNLPPLRLQAGHHGFFIIYAIVS